MIFQSITVNICCYDKSPKFERKMNDLYTTQGQIIKFVWNIPLIFYDSLDFAVAHWNSLHGTC